MQFVFSPLNRKIDWRRLAFINIEKVIDDVDLDVLEENLANISCCDIAQEMDGYDVNRCFLNLFKLAQLIIQYLLFMQRVLTNKIKELRDLCEAKLNNVSSNLHTPEEILDEHRNQRNIDQHSELRENQGYNEHGRTDEHESVRSEMRRKEKSPGELPTNAGLMNRKYYRERNYGSQQPWRLSTKEENERNSVQEVSDPKKLRDEIVGRVRRTKKNISMIATKLNDFMLEARENDIQITSGMQKRNQSFEVTSRRTSGIVLQSTTGSFTASSISPSGSTVKRELAESIQRRDHYKQKHKRGAVSDV